MLVVLIVIAALAVEPSFSTTSRERRNDPVLGGHDAAGVKTEDPTELNELLEGLHERLKSLEQKNEFLVRQERTRRDVPRTCQDIKNLGISESGKYLIDPDGTGRGDPPITVTCDLSGSYGVTKIQPNIIIPDASKINCSQPQCDVYSISYNATEKQMKALKDLSVDCSQSISYSCPSRRNINSLSGQSLAWWYGSNNESYWNPDNRMPSRTNDQCGCDPSSSCSISRSSSCNCVQNLSMWVTDEVTHMDYAALPVKKMKVGRLTDNGKQVKVVLKQFTCYGRKPFEASASPCITLQEAGNTGSGYYLVDGPDGENYDLVKCNMHLDPGQQEFQVATKVKLAQYPVAFHSTFTQQSLDKEQTTVGIIRPFNNSRLNDGNGMGTNGIFTAPLSGVYEFAFTTLECMKSGATWVQIRVNEVPLMNLYMKSDQVDEKNSTTNFIPGSMTAIVRVQKGQTVDAYLRSGSVCGDPDNPWTHFTGHLLYPTD